MGMHVCNNNNNSNNINFGVHNACIIDALSDMWFFENVLRNSILFEKDSQLYDSVRTVYLVGKWKIRDGSDSSTASAAALRCPNQPSTTGG